MHILIAGTAKAVIARMGGNNAVTNAATGIALCAKTAGALTAAGSAICIRGTGLGGISEGRTGTVGIRRTGLGRSG